MLCYLAGASSPIAFVRSWTSSLGALLNSGYQTWSTEEGAWQSDVARKNRLLSRQVFKVLAGSPLANVCAQVEHVCHNRHLKNRFERRFEHTLRKVPPIKNRSFSYENVI